MTRTHTQLTRFTTKPLIKAAVAAETLVNAAIKTQGCYYFIILESNRSHTKLPRKPSQQISLTIETLKKKKNRKTTLQTMTVVLARDQTKARLMANSMVFWCSVRGGVATVCQLFTLGPCILNGKKSTSKEGPFTPTPNVPVGNHIRKDVSGTVKQFF